LADNSAQWLGLMYLVPNSDPSGPAYARPEGSVHRTGCRRAGFTLIELTIGMAIAAILGSIAMQSYSNYRERVMVRQAISDISALNANVRHYMTDNRVPPASLAAAGAPGKLDPWGNPYVYTDLTTANIGQARKNKNLVPINSEFDLYSMGKDGQSAAPLTAANSRDDIILANDGSYIGLASDYE
jgi:general secretion pathway protein G